jgi:hypothetical protein
MTQIKSTRGLSRFLVLFSLACIVPFAFGQADRGSISGKITDSTGAVIPETNVALRDEATGIVQSTRTNNAGAYIFQALNPGSYTITVDRNGFRKSEYTHVVVDVNATNVQNIELQIGSTNSTVTVQAGIQELSTTSASQSLVVEQRSIQELPLIYGNPFTLEVLAPGILPSGVNPNIHTYDSSTASVSVNGSALNSIEYRLDGAPDNRIRLSAFTPSTEMINQYRVETASYDATEGHSSGGFVNVSLKSGTDQFHGGAFVYYQNPSINANTWTTNGSSGAAKPLWVREGGEIGGPVWKNKAFFFFGFEHTRAGNPNVQLLTVPTLAERTGDFSALYAQDTKHPAGPTNTWQIYNPTSGYLCTSTGTEVCRTPYANNQVTNISPLAQKILGYYPQPNLAGTSTGGNNYSYAASEPDYYHALSGRIDYNPTAKQVLFGHLVWSQRQQYHKNAYFFPASGTTLTYKNRGVALGYTYTLSPATVLDAHLTWTRFINQNVLPSQGIVGPVDLGMPDYLIAGLAPAANAFPRFDNTGYTSLNSDSGVLSNDDVSLGSIQISHQIGNHFLRTGFEYRMYNTNGTSTSQSNGDYSSTGNYATANSNTTAQAIGQSLAQFETGVITTAKITINSDMAIRDNYLAGWLQDDWKASNRLVINAGLRWEYEGPMSERNYKANTYFDFNAVNPVAGAAQANYALIYPKFAAANPILPAASSFAVNGGLRFAGQNGFGHQLYHTQIVNLLPRIGLSFRPEENTVIHAGFGIFYDSLNSFYVSGGNSGSTSTFLVQQQGFSASSSQNGSADSGLTFPATLANPFPSGITQPTGSSLGLSTFLGQSVAFQPPNPKNIYNERWSLDLQHQFHSWLAMLGYVGNYGAHIPVQQQYNNIPQQYLSTVNNTLDYAEYLKMNPATAPTNPFYYGNTPGMPNNGVGGSKTISVGGLLLPYPEFGSISAWVDTGSSNYNSLQAMLIRRFTNGASFTSAFTWSKTLDATQFLNNADPRLWYGLSTNDRALRLAMSGIYELPFGRGRQHLNNTNKAVASVISGWQVQGVYQVQSGQPLSFTQSSYIPVYLAGNNPATSSWSRSAYKKTIQPGAAGYWFDTSKWANINNGWSTGTSGCTTATGLCSGDKFPNAQYQLRTMPLRFGTLRADRLNQFDAGIQRNFIVWRETQLQFRAEAVNALNHPVYSAPVTDPTNTAFGEITSQANQPRVFQFSAFLRF